jgi:hypothetical protein
MPPSMQASLDPVVEVPTTSVASGALQRSAMMFTQRRWISASADTRLVDHVLQLVTHEPVGAARVHSPSGSRSLGTVAVASVDGDSTSVASWDFLTP